MEMIRRVVVGFVVAGVVALTLGSVSPVSAVPAPVTCADILDTWGIIQADETDSTIKFVNPDGLYSIGSIDQLYCLGEGVYDDADDANDDGDLGDVGETDDGDYSDGGIASSCADAPLSGLLQATFTLENDLDFDDLTVSGVTDWRPIGSNACQFTGIFDGNSKTIDNLTYDLPFQVNETSTAYEAVGLFGSTGRDAPTLIKNVDLANLYFAGWQDVGGLIGIADKNTTVQNVSVEGELRAGQGGYGDLGGIIGWSNGEVAGPNVVDGAIVDVTLGLETSLDPDLSDDHSWSAGGVVGFASHTQVSDVDSVLVVNDVFLYGVGGIVGYADGGNSVSDSTAEVDTTAGQALGGVIGWDNGSEIQRVMATVDISGSLYLGGIVGGKDGGAIGLSSATGVIDGTGIVGGIGGYIGTSEIADVMTSVNLTANDTVGGLVGQIMNSQISNSYARGVVVTNPGSPTEVGGLVGADDDNPSLDESVAGESFWDTDVSGQSTSPLGVGKTTAQMKTQSTFAAWDIAGQVSDAHTWGICNGINAGYPFLQELSFPGTCVPVVSSGGSVPVVETTPVVPVTITPVKPTISPSIVAGMTPAQIRALTADLIRAMDVATLRALSPTQVRRLTGDQLNVMTGFQFSKLTPDSIGAIRPKVLAMVRRALLKSMTNRQIKALTDAQLDELPPRLVDALLDR